MGKRRNLRFADTGALQLVDDHGEAFHKALS